MSKAIEDYTAAVETQFSAIGTSVDELVTSLAGVTGDVTSLKSIIDKLQSSPGPISPEDQKLLDDGVAKASALATKVAGVSAALKALDDATETPPPAP